MIDRAPVGPRAEHIVDRAARRAHSLQRDLTAVHGAQHVDLQPPAEIGRRQIDQRRPGPRKAGVVRSEEHTSELQSLMRISYAVFCLQKKKLQSLQPISTPVSLLTINIY